MGPFTDRAMSGRVAAPSDPTQILRDRTPRGRCSGSFSIIHSCETSSSTPSQRLLGEAYTHAESDVGDIACLLSGGNRACLRSLTARPLALPLRQCAGAPEVEVDPLSWSPSGFKRRLFRCPRRVRPIHLSFVARSRQPSKGRMLRRFRRRVIAPLIVSCRNRELGWGEWLSKSRRFRS